MDKGPAGGLDEDNLLGVLGIGLVVAGAQLSYLTGAARHRVLVAAHAARRVIHRSQPVRDCLNLFELLPVLVEGILGLEPVCRIVEACRRFPRLVRGLRLGRCLRSVRTIVGISRNRHGKQQSHTTDAKSASQLPDGPGKHPTIQCRTKHGITSSGLLHWYRIVGFHDGPRSGRGLTIRSPAETARKAYTRPRSGEAPGSSAPVTCSRRPLRPGLNK